MYFMKYKFKMRIKIKPDELTPWQTKQEALFVQSMVPEIPKIKEITQENERMLISLEKKYDYQKRSLSALQSLVRLKTQTQNSLDKVNFPQRKHKIPSIRQLKPINSNLISIINTYHQSNPQKKPQDNSKKLGTKRNPKQHSKFQTLNRNYSSQTHKKQHKPINIDIKKIKQTLFQKRNPSLETLIKAKQQLQKINQTRNSPILRTYSVHNMRLNTFLYKEKGQETIINSLITKNMSNFLSNSVQTKAMSRNQSSKLRPRQISCVDSDKKQHIIDRLYDKFY